MTTTDMPNRISDALRAYGIGLGSLVAALVLRALADPWLGPNLPYATMFGAVALAVWFGGVGPALFVTVVGFYAGTSLFLHEPGVLVVVRPEHLIGLALYLMSCLIIVGFGSALRMARQRALTSATRLRESEERLRLAQQAARIGTFEWKVSTNVNVMSPDLLALYGLRSDQGMGTYDTWLSCVHPEDRAGADAAVRESRASGVFDHDFRVVWPDGSIHWLSGRARWYLDGMGQPERMVGINVDITDRKNTEESLRRSEHLYRAIGESINYGIWVCDPQGRNIYASDSFLRLVGLSQEECSSLGWLRVLHPDDVEATAAAWDECVRRGGFWEREHRFKGVDGQWHHVLARGVPIRDDQGAITHWAGINLDISDLKKAQEALQEADQRKNEFLATLAHELRNPLAAIRNVTRLLQARGQDTPEARWSSGVVERQVQHLARLVEDLLDVSRITRGKVTLRRERLLLSAVVLNAVETSRHAIEAGRHHLDVALPDAPLFLEGDLTRLSQVLENLLSNAAKYTPAGGHIRVDARAEGPQVILSVVDDGVGIPEAMLTRVFEMFTQVDGALDRSTGGLGIGLTLVKRLVEMHGGTVGAFSEGLGRGSRFEVRLPLATSRPEAKPAEIGRPARRETMAPRRVLVVDDNRDAADSLALLLQGAGHEVHTVYDGEQALDAAEQTRPEIILMDIGLPGLSGYQVARWVREQPWGQDLLLVALTGWGQEEDRRRSREAGFNLHMVKPLDLEALNEVLVSQV